jgi:hypothetical protein
MDENSKAMEDMQKPWHEKLAEEKAKEKEQQEQQSVGVVKGIKRDDRRVPHLTNLSDDEQINGKAYYSLLDCNLSLCLLTIL